MKLIIGRGEGKAVQRQKHKVVNSIGRHLEESRSESSESSESSELRTRCIGTISRTEHFSDFGSSPELISKLVKNQILLGLTVNAVC